MTSITLTRVGAAIALIAMATDIAAADEFTNRWRVLFPTAAAKTPLKPLDDLSFSGPHVGHPFYLGDFDSDASWTVTDGLLHAQDAEGGNAALLLGEAENFELEGIADASGTGGMFFLVGVTDGRGYGVWNCTMRESGSPWGVFEIRGDQAVEGTAADLGPYEWKREQPFKLTVQDGLLTFTLGKRDIIEQHPVPNYAAGQVIMGVYDTRYGPRALKVRALRARSRPPGKPDPEAPTTDDAPKDDDIADGDADGSGPTESDAGEAVGEETTSD